MQIIIRALDNISTHETSTVDGGGGDLRLLRVCFWCKALQTVRKSNCLPALHTRLDDISGGELGGALTETPVPALHLRL